ncbi:M24 family metallopeptidase [Desulfofundulus thermosubterraneus]|uniref:Xaa-Pro dipeptidase n=1 Tax=Desulfofundulus thermosubterraneus DSM 16057 TaxID=1121432 RepID=A0A1M6A726_9FIRM|nr:Xaa-Pro peptidase family protein [Desulfofundulus thermosubterraneus]SHI32250.1 Xaa-Pro dipeptidase [Desulfofundulus thermosubterraneus DSM 16057]
MDVFSKRVARVQQLMGRKGIDYLVLAPTANMFYLTGLKTVADERLQVAVLPAEGPLTLVLPEMYKEYAAKIHGHYRLLTWPDHQDPVELVMAAVTTKQGRVAVDEKMWAGHFLSIMRAFSGFQFVAARDVMSEVRVCKDETELTLLEQAGKLVDRVMGEVLKEMREGVTEKELALFIENTIKALGAEDISFKPIVASGPNGSLPHHITGDRKLQKGDFIVLDFGAVVGGYCSDITRTFCLGKATPEGKEVYRVVQEANELGFQSAREGVPCGDVDRAARSLISRAGYGDYFIHRTGHGIGLDYHEDPYLVEGNTTPLRQGMVFSVEPGIYLPGKLGVRIEDIVAVTSDGPIRLNNFPRELIEI